MEIASQDAEIASENFRGVGVGGSGGEPTGWRIPRPCPTSMRLPRVESSSSSRFKIGVPSVYPTRGARTTLKGIGKSTLRRWTLHTCATRPSRPGLRGTIGRNAELG